jgi:hypothetical protein
MISLVRLRKLYLEAALFSGHKRVRLQVFGIVTMHNIEKKLHFWIISSLSKVCIRNGLNEELKCHFGTLYRLTNIELVKSLPRINDSS